MAPAYLGKLFLYHKSNWNIVKNTVEPCHMPNRSLVNSLFFNLLIQQPCHYDLILLLAAITWQQGGKSAWSYSSEVLETLPGRIAFISLSI